MVDSANRRAAGHCARHLGLLAILHRLQQVPDRIHLLAVVFLQVAGAVFHEG